MDLATDTIEANLPDKPQEADRAAAVQSFYDTGGIPMLRLASQHYVESATAEHRLRLSSGMEELLEELKAEFPPTTAARTNAPLRYIPSLGESVHCVGARWDVDSLAAQMVAHCLAVHGYNASYAENPLFNTGEQTDTPAWNNARWLIVSIFHPQPQAQARLILRRIRRIQPSAPHFQVILALWNAPASLLSEGVAQRMGVQGLITSMRELVLRLQQLNQAEKPDRSEKNYIPASIPDDENERLIALQNSRLLELPQEQLFHATAQKAANAFDVKYAQISIVDREWVHTPGSLITAHLHSMKGLPREQSICSYVVYEHAPVIVENVTRDPRFSENPSLLAAHVRFYAGVPLKDEKGQVLGSLCILHDAPRTISKDEVALLTEMANELMEEIKAAAESPRTPWK